MSSWHVKHVISANDTESLQTGAQDLLHPLKQDLTLGLTSNGDPQASLAPDFHPSKPNDDA